MIRRSDKDIGIGSDRFTDYTKVLRRTSHQSDIRLEVPQRCDNTMAITHIDSDIDLRVMLHERGDEPRRKVFCGHDESEAHAPAEMPISTVKCTQELRHHIVDARRSCDHFFARLG